MKRKAIVLLLSIFCPACEEVLSPDDIGLESVPDAFVIEGYVSNEKGPYSIRLSRSAGYFQPNTFTTISNAHVEIADDGGQREVLKHIGQGVYQTDKLQGIEGRTYFLTVAVAGKTFTAQSVLNPTVPVNHISYRFRPAVEHANKEGYFVTVEAPDPGGQRNFYRVKAFINGNAFRDTDDYIALADYTFDGGTLRFEFPAEYKKNDLAEMELWSLDYPSYLFYSSFGEQINAPSKGPFGAQPGNVRSNIQGGAMGLFCAYSVSHAHVRIE